MRRLPQNISLLAVSILTVSAVAVAPVYARDGVSGTEDSDTTTAASVSEDSGTATGGGRGPGGISVRLDSSTNTENETENETEHTTLKASSGDLQDLQQKAQKLLQDKRQNGKAKTVAQRQQACNAHEAEITNRAQNYAKAAQNHLDVFSGIYSKVLAFQAAKNLNATNFDSLKATADAKKAAAESAVAALSDPSVTTLDCTAQDPASTVAALKTAVADARTALQDYRLAIKNVIVALESAKTTSGTSTDTNTSKETN